MEKINLAERLNFNNDDLVAPDVVLKDLAEQIEKETKGIITAVVGKYDAPIENYQYKKKVPKSGLVGLGEVLGIDNCGDELVDVNIQDDLGRFGEDIFKYAFYLTTSVFEQYQYRICFIQYNASYYPVKVVLEQSIADEINKNEAKNGFIYNCNSRSELEELLIKVICSKKMLGIMQELVNIYNIHKNNNKLTNVKTTG